MEEGKPSKSAMFAAMTRAAHLFLDDEPKILRDDFALELSGLKDKAKLTAALKALHAEIEQGSTPEYAEAFLKSYRGFSVVRHRYTEDELNKALKRGISQFVILGAGLDSFAYRRRDLENKLRIFEVDHPATQQWKVARLQKLKISTPCNLTFVPVDFEKQTLTDELNTHGFKKDFPAFFSMLGVAPYLTEAAVFQTLREVVSMTQGSEIIFEYLLLESLLEGEDRQMVARSKAPDREEPWLSEFDPLLLAQSLREMGFIEVSDFGYKNANALYYKGRTDELSPSAQDGLSPSILRLAHLMKARVGKKT